jgi:hypothetical protein
MQVRNDWVIENNNYRYFDNNSQVIAQVYKFRGIWHAYVLGMEKQIQDKQLRVVLEQVDIALKQCGWE